MSTARTGVASADVRDRLLYLAWRWHGIPADVAEDLIQSSFATWLELREGHAIEDPAEGDLDTRLMIGVFRNTCREYVARRAREARNLSLLMREIEDGNTDVARTPAQTTNEDGALHEMEEVEDLGRVLESLDRARAPAREFFRLITEEGATRADLARRYGLDQRSLDARLGTYREEMRRTLADRGVEV